ncbi:MAG TPA: MopE-related protein [Bacteroidia bacterium]|nr:MopE-related protein [Bacteroidia bacterium]HNU33194.1 MopE-related protein [Bacteroidia bacterium]
MKKTNYFLRKTVLTMVASLTAFVAMAQTDVYVDIAATGANNGSSWANAYTDLNLGLAAANAGTGAYNIYVAQGTYYATAATLTGNPLPTSAPPSLNYAFCIKREGIRLYGGYATGGASRNFKTNLTILNANGNYHAMVVCGINSSADSVVVDGVRMTNGSNYTGLGSGNVTINGVQVFNSQGGGVNVMTSTSAIAFRNCDLRSNSGGYGGGAFVFNVTNTSFNNCVFYSNSSAGGPGGGICIQNSTTLLKQCVFINNSAAGYFQASGGGIYSSGTSNVTVLNSTFSNNTAPGSAATGLSILQDAGTGVLTIRNSILWSADATKNVSLGTYDITYSDVRQPSAPIAGTGNINSDPLFTNAGDPDGADNILTTADDGVQLGATSPARDVGNNADVPVSLISDITGSGRIYPAIVDMGAYEGGVTASSNCVYPDLNLFATAGAASYSWTGPNGFTSTQQNPVITNAGAADAGVYTVVATSPSSFTSSGTTTVVMSNWYQDLDGDGKGNAAVILISCSQPAGYVSNSSDCNDNAPAVFTPATAVLSGSGAICHGNSKALTITCTGTGPFNGTLSDGTIFSGATSPVTVNVSPVVSSTTYTIATYADVYNACPPTMSGSATVTVTGIPPTTVGGSTTGPGTVNLSASGNGTLNWYDDPTAGNLVNTGSSYSPFISSTQTFYVSNTEGSNGSTAVGVPSPTTGTPASTSPISRGMTFTVAFNCVFNSITIYPTATGSGTVLLRTSGGVLLLSIPYTVTAIEINTAKVITINYSLSPGNYTLTRVLGPSAKFENTGIAFPYTAAGSPVTITTPIGGAFYWFFYNWQVSYNNQCISSRTPVTATYINNNVTWYLDADNDGWYVNTQIASTSPGTGWTDVLPVNGAGDCDDNSNTVYPGATEILCNSIDENCNGMADDGVQSTAASVISSDAQFNEICLGGSVNLTLSGGSLGTGAVWNWYSGSCNGSIVGSGTTISVTPTATTTFFVKAEGACNTTNCVQLTIAVKTAPPSASVLVPPINNLPDYACTGIFISNLNIPVVSSASFYVWDGPAGTSFNGGNNPYSTQNPSADITFGNPSGSGYYIGVQAANACGTSLRKVQWARGLVGIPASVDPSIATLQTYCVNTSATFSCPLVAGATGYLWSITGDATIIPSGNTVTVNFGPSWSSGTLCVSALTPCFTSAPKCLSLSTAQAPAYSSNGVFTVCGGSTHTYSVPFDLDVATYTWTLPPNSTGSSVTNTINVSYNLGFAAGNICVQATSICGVQLPQKCKSVTTGAATTPASITGTTSGLCGTTATYTCTPQSGATFNWILPAGATGSSNSNSIDVTFPNSGFTTATLSVEAVNLCGPSGLRTITVKGPPNTPGTISANPGVWCNNDAGIQFTSNLSGLSGSYNLAWSVTPATRANYINGQGTNSYLVDWNTGNATVILTASNGCGSGSRTYNAVTSCKIANNTNEFNSDENVKGEVSIFPNPSNGKFVLKLDIEKKQTIEVQITDIAGKTVGLLSYNLSDGKSNIEMDFSKQPKGVYQLKFKTNEITFVKKIVIQ